MIPLREAFLRNRQHFIQVLGDDLGFVPFTERSRKQGLGEEIPSLTAAIREEADRLVAESSNHPGKGGQVNSPLHPSQPLFSPRLEGLPILAATYREARDERYAKAARMTYLDWIATHPTRKEWSWDDLVHGLYSWLGPLHVFFESSVFNDETVEQVISSTRTYLDYLSNEIHPTRNLRISSAASLLNNSLRLAFLPEAKRWLEQSAHIMTDACRRQIHPDGSHLEATPHYHFCTMGDILNVFRKARMLPELNMPISAERVALMYDYLVAATRPTGWIASIHDGPCEPAAALCGKGVEDVLTERREFRRSLGLAEAIPPAVQVFPHAGQIFLRDSWEKEAVYVTFEASPCRSYHWHPARNSIQLQAYGRMLLLDPGRFSYRDKAWEVYAHQTRSHSTLNLNGWNQSESHALLRHRFAPGYDVVEGFYNGGYWPGQRTEGHGEGIQGEHHRTLLWIRERCIIVIDHLFCASEAGRKPTLESVWQLDEGEVTLLRDKEGYHRASTRHPDANLFLLFALQPKGMKATLHHGKNGSPTQGRGWRPKQFETDFVPAPQIVLSAERHEPWNTDLVTVLVPYRHPTEAAGDPHHAEGYGKASEGHAPPRGAPQVTVTKVIDPEESGDLMRPGYGSLALRWRDGSTDEIFWTRRMESALNEREGIMTNGSLVHLHKNAEGAVVKGLVVDGTWLEPYAPQPQRPSGTFSFPSSCPV